MLLVAYGYNYSNYCFTPVPNISYVVPPLVTSTPRELIPWHPVMETPSQILNNELALLEKEVSWIPEDYAFPAVSAVVPNPVPFDDTAQPEGSSTSPLGTPRHLSKKQLAQFKLSLPSAVQVQLDQPFGKDSLSHSFTSDISFAHVLVFLYDDHWLDRKSLRALEYAIPLA